MKLKRITLAALMGLATSFALVAHDFATDAGGNRLFFKITSKANNTVEVTYPGAIADRQVSEAKGRLVIPPTVKHNGKTYTVNAISPKAFAMDTKLTGVVIPTTVTKIGSFAFEGCTRLKSIVFPSKQTEMGEGVFFRCDSISDITFGGDWTTIDLNAFRWSDNLRTLVIPAKVTKLRGFKSIRNLSRIEVDRNNSHFSTNALGDALYSADGKTLYGVPRGATSIAIEPGTVTVTPGALVDCKHMTFVSVPSSVKSLSFREFSRMPNLSRVLFAGTNLPVTAYTTDNQPVRVLWIANPKVKIEVAPKAKSLVTKTLVSTGGEYKESTSKDAIPYSVDAQQLATKKNVVSNKSISLQ